MNKYPSNNSFTEEVNLGKKNKGNQKLKKKLISMPQRKKNW